MIKFFRRIRQQLLSQNRFGKYIIYAIGEMVLVIFGILIAIQINNRNISKQQLQKEVIYLKEISKSLKSDLINEIKPAIKSYENTVILDSLLTLNFYGSSIKISSDSLRFLITRIGNNWGLLLNTAAFDNVKSIGMDLISNDELRVKILEVYGYHYKYLAEKQNQFRKHYIERWQPARDEVIGRWHWGTIKTASELESIRKNTQFQAIIGSSIYHTKNRIFYLKMAKPKVEQLLVEIEKEIDRLKE